MTYTAPIPHLASSYSTRSLFVLQRGPTFVRLSNPTITPSPIQFAMSEQIDRDTDPPTTPGGGDRDAPHLNPHDSTLQSQTRRLPDLPSTQPLKGLRQLSS